MTCIVPPGVCILDVVPRLSPSALRLIALATLAASSASAVAQEAPRIVQPGAPGAPTRVITAEQAADTSDVRHGPADVRFMQGMLGHHAQALEMIALVPERTRSEALSRLALRMDVSQRDEMQMMREWLTRRGESAPDPHAHHGHTPALMPGMLSEAQMQRLAASSGSDFDRLFLAGMIQHHEGALTMVEELFATPGAGQEPEIFDFASDVEADQRMEIARMRALLQELEK